MIKCQILLCTIDWRFKYPEVTIGFLAMITVKCDFIVLSMILMVEIQNGTGEARMAYVECSVMFSIKQRHTRQKISLKLI